MAWYDLLAEAFRAWQLHLKVAPHPHLLAQQNPYDGVHANFWFWDMTLHNGRYYMYWGPVPGLVLAAVKGAFGIEREVGDHLLTLGFMVVRLLAGAAFIWVLLRRCLPRAPAWLAPLFILVFGVGGPVPFFLSRGAVYEASIAGGQCFVALAMLCALAALADLRLRLFGLVWAGLCLALAFGSRVSLVVAAGVFGLATMLVLFYQRQTLRRFVLESLALGVPLLSGVLLFGVYNKARFGSFFDMGIEKQLSSMKFTFSFVHFVPNLYTYLLRAPELSCRFPYVRLPWTPGVAAFPQGMQLPEGHVAHEPVMGFLWGTPFVLLAPLLCVVLLRRDLRERLFTAQQQKLVLWAVVASAVLATVPLLPALGLWMGTVRYQIDVIGPLVVLAALAAAVLLELARGVARWLAAGLVLVLCTTSIGWGLLLGFQGYQDHFRLANPALLDRLQKEASVCAESPPGS